MESFNNSLVNADTRAFDEFISSLPNKGHFGDRRPEKEAGTGRVVLLNVDAVPERGFEFKQQQIFRWWQRDRVDVAMLTETGRYWPALPEEERWKERIRGKFEDGVHSSLAFNLHEKRSSLEGSHQYGGTGTFVIGQMSHRVRDSGQDPSGLGRWSWIRLAGRLVGRSQHQKGDERWTEELYSDVVFVTGYRPNGPGDGT